MKNNFILLFLVSFTISIQAQKTNESGSKSAKKGDQYFPVTIKPQVLNAKAFKSRKETVEYSRLVVTITGVRGVIHSESCKVMDGTFTINLAKKNECKDNFIAPVEGDKVFKGLRDNNTHWSRWSTKKIGKYDNAKPHSDSPNNYSKTMIYKVPTKLIVENALNLNVSYFLHACHTRNNNNKIYGKHVIPRNCTRVYQSSSSYKSNVEFKEYNADGSVGNTNLMKGPMNLIMHMSDVEGASHRMSLHFKVSILK